MRYFIQLLTILSLFLLQACSEAPIGVQNLNPSEFQALLTQEKGLLIDVRTPEEYIEGHIKGSATIDFYAADFKMKLSSLDREKVVFIYCASGGRSKKASKMAHELGFNEIYNLVGGFNAWDEAGLAVQK